MIKICNFYYTKSLCALIGKSLKSRTQMKKKFKQDSKFSKFTEKICIPKKNSRKSLNFSITKLKISLIISKMELID